MEYRINSYNKDYIMLDKIKILMESIKLIKENEEMEKLLRNLWYEIIAIEQKQIKKTSINEIAINKNSKLAKLIFKTAKKHKTSTIKIEQIINALLISIEDQLWKYNFILSNLIRYYKKNNIDNINYEYFSKEHGEEITLYIVSNNLRVSNINNYHDDKNVYLYENGIITQTELPEQKLSTGKTKKRTIN